jgi:hypothetical protein
MTDGGEVVRLNQRSTQRYRPIKVEDAMPYQLDQGLHQSFKEYEHVGFVQAKATEGPGLDRRKYT